GEFIPEYYNAHINPGGQFTNMLKHEGAMTINIFNTPIKK
ncbi:hypothetical protein BAZOLSSOX_1266, partial [uncultured Gammaproteobacteria bacterium]